MFTTEQIETWLRDFLAEYSRQVEQSCPDRWKERLTLYNHFPPRIDVIGAADGEYLAALFLAPRLGYNSEPGEPEINVDLSFPDREAAEQRRNLAQDNFSAMDAWLVTLRFTWPEFSQLPALPVFVGGYIESELPGNPESRTFVDHLDAAFVSRSYRVERNPFLGRVQVDIYATKKGKSFGLIPYVDHFFVFILESEPERSLETLLSVNRNALTFVDSVHRTPHLWRWTVPTTVTIAISSGGIPSATTEYLREQNLSAMGVPNSLSG